VDFDRLFDDVYPGLVRYCHRMTADADLAEDAAQEAFVRYLDRRPRGELPGLRAWLYKVATHLLRDRARVEDNRVRLRSTHAAELAPGAGGANHDLSRTGLPVVDPSAVVDHLEREARIAGVREALRTLDPRDRTLLLLREEGLSYRELADAVGVQASSVGTLLARARRRLEQALVASIGESPSEASLRESRLPS
jgi:RNA polymerase sigma factor (sigma-70 family)